MSVDVSDFGCDRCGSLSCGRRNAVHGLVVLGAKGVGKSALVVQLMTHRFIHEYDSSGDCLYETKIPVGDHCSTLKIVDAVSSTAVNDLDLTCLDGVILVYSITDDHSFKSAIDLKTEVDKCLQSRRIRRRPCYLLVGNKTDLAHQRVVTDLEGRQAASMLGCEHVTLAARGHWSKVESAFQSLVERIRANKRQQGRRHWTTVVDQVISNRSSVSSAHSSSSLLTSPVSEFPESSLGDTDDSSGASSGKRGSLKRVIKRVSSFNLKRASRSSVRSDSSADTVSTCREL